jgi:hypothetical protein
MQVRVNRLHEAKTQFRQELNERSTRSSTGSMISTVAAGEQIAVRARRALEELLEDHGARPLLKLSATIGSRGIPARSSLASSLMAVL